MMEKVIIIMIIKKMLLFDLDGDFDENGLG